MNNTIKQNIKEVMSLVLEIPNENIDDGSSPDTIESWDSLRHMNLIVALEEKFKIQFTDEEIVEMMSFSIIESIINGKR
mgnify:CR=1 FL=1